LHQYLLHQLAQPDSEQHQRAKVSVAAELRKAAVEVAQVDGANLPRKVHRRASDAYQIEKWP
jgi:hypothetical protein